jgi:hypothetical protein
MSSITFVIILSRSFNSYRSFTALLACVLQLRRLVPLVASDFFVLRTFGKERPPTVAMAETTCFAPGPWPGDVLKDFFGESLGDSDARRRRFPC